MSASMSSPLSSSSEDFSVLSASNSNLRSRSSTQSYAAVEVAPSTSTFSDLGAEDLSSPRTPSRSLTSSQVLSATTTDDSRSDYDDEFILVPPSSALMRSRSIATAAFAAPVDEDDEDEDEEILLLRSPPPPARASGNFRSPSMQVPPAPHTEESDDDEAEEIARANQRLARAEEDEENENDGDADSDGESILFNAPMQRLSISGTPSRPSPALNPSVARSQAQALDETLGGARDTPTPTRRHFAVPSPSTPKPIPAAPIPVARPPPARPTMAVVDMGPAALTATERKAAKKARARVRAKARKQLKKLQQASNSGSDTASSSNESPSPTTPTAKRGDRLGAPMYAAAIRHVTAYIQNPPESPSVEDRLHFLQSLIIELGLLNKSTIELPTSCKAAKALLKSEVHINVGEYVKCRTELSTKVPSLLSASSLKKKGVLAIQQAELNVWLAEMPKLMFSSKAALRHGLHTGIGRRDGTKTKRVTKKWIKARGLEVFLVNY